MNPALSLATVVSREIVAASKPLAIDLFSGAGGMSLGFEQAGFNVVAGFDNDTRNVTAYRRNFPNSSAVLADLATATGEDVKTLSGTGGRLVDVVFGGPPCQAFSLMGKRRSDDPRAMLLHHFGRLVAELSSSYFVVENVAGLAMGNAVTLLERFILYMEKAGYVVAPLLMLDASAFGVPQRRKRIFIIGRKRGLPAPNEAASDPSLATPCVKDALGDLPNVDEIPELLESDIYSGPLGDPSDYATALREPREDGTREGHSSPAGPGLSGCLRTKHTAETIARFNNTKPGTHEPISRFYRLEESGIANTIRAGTGPDGGSFTAPRPIHPLHPRCITVREAARLQSFPDWFSFDSTKWHGFRQIGNAVPPKLAMAVARTVFQEIE